MVPACRVVMLVEQLMSYLYFEIPRDSTLEAVWKIRGHLAFTPARRLESQRSTVQREHLGRGGPKIAQTFFLYYESSLQIIMAPRTHHDINGRASRVHARRSALS